MYEEYTYLRERFNGRQCSWSWIIHQVLVWEEYLSYWCSNSVYHKYILHWQAAIETERRGKSV